jgi:hypothetical protein
MYMNSQILSSPSPGVLLDFDNTVRQDVAMSLTMQQVDWKLTIDTLDDILLAGRFHVPKLDPNDRLECQTVVPKATGVVSLNWNLRTDEVWLNVTMKHLESSKSVALMQRLMMLKHAAAVAAVGFQTHSPDDPAWQVCVAMSWHAESFEATELEYFDFFLFH